MKTALYVNGAADSDEGVRLLKEAGIKFRRVPANDHTMPQLVVGGMEFQGLGQIRWYLNCLRIASLAEEE